MDYIRYNTSSKAIIPHLGGLTQFHKTLAFSLLLLFAPVVMAQTPHATGIDVANKTVYLNDLEDHTWTYYSDKPDTQYPDALRSPDPRNVKITYRGGSVSGASAVAVSNDESANTFVYYKTIEKLAWGNSTGRWLTGEYAYRVIPNPFSKRPKNGTTYYGFGGWKIVSGYEYVRRENGNMAAENAVLNLEEKINFVNLDYDASDPNAVTAEVVFEATWVTATVVTFNKNGNISDSDPTGLNTSGTYETNFIVVTDSRTHTVSGLTKGVTISSCYPDGTAGGGNPIISGFTTSSAPVKLEYIKIGDGRVTVPPSAQTATSPTTKGSGDFVAGGAGNLIVGRGCVGTVIHVNSSNNGRQYSFRIESGKYSIMNPLYNGANSNSNTNNWCRVVLGCDYDRATGENENLRILNYIGANRNSATGSNASELQDITVKSGYYGFSANYSLYDRTKNSDSVDGYGLGIGGNTDGYSGTYTPTGTSNSYSFPSVSNPETSKNQTWFKNLSFYVGPTRSAGKGGVNRLLVEGGEFNNINGGGTNPGDQSTIGFYFRMKGGWVKGAVYGTASISNSSGSRSLVFTGGEVNGWVAGGCNGTDFGSGQGYNEGTCYIYAGGRTEFRSHNRDGVYTNASGLVFNVPGGQIFGAGRGLAGTGSQVRYCGSTTTAYVVVADEAEVEQNVYGGGYNGVSQYSYVYVTGGTVDGKVFGGTAKAESTDNTWRCRSTDVRMYGGTVLGGVYGSHDETGNQYDDANVLVLGGTVGAENQTLGDGSRDHDLGNVFGCGYGVSTEVNGNVVVVIGDSTARTPHVDNPIIWGNVFCGGHEANYTSTNKTFKVMGYNGTVKQCIYGGGKGVLNENKGTITGNTLVWLKGSIRVGNIFGGGLAGVVNGKTDVRVTD